MALDIIKASEDWGKRGFYATEEHYSTGCEAHFEFSFAEIAAAIGSNDAAELEKAIALVRYIVDIIACRMAALRPKRKWLTTVGNWRTWEETKENEAWIGLRKITRDNYTKTLKVRAFWAHLHRQAQAEQRTAAEVMCEFLQTAEQLKTRTLEVLKTLKSFEGWWDGPIMVACGLGSRMAHPDFKEWCGLYRELYLPEGFPIELVAPYENPPAKANKKPLPAFGETHFPHCL